MEHVQAFDFYNYITWAVRTSTLQQCLNEIKDQCIEMC